MGADLAERAGVVGPSAHRRTRQSSIVRRVASRWPFVGREGELARAERVVASGAGVLLLGEAGIGKTSLARRLSERATTGGAGVVGVVGRAVSSGAPFDAFAGVLTARPPTPAGAQLTAAEVAAAVEATAAGTRLVMVVDDVDLLDADSARVLLQLVSTGSATLIATARSASGPGVAERLWREGHCERIELGGLSDDGVAELVETVLEGPADIGVGPAFASRSQGNPLLLRELIQAALARAVLVRRESVWVLAGPLPLSGGIRELVAERLAGLSDVERTALDAVAAGEPLPLDVALTMVGEARLTELEQARLVAVTTGPAGADVSTAHPLYGDVLRADMPTLRLRRLRLALAEALETFTHAGPHDLVRAATWRLDSGQADDPDRLLAAARAARAVSLDTAERLARHAHQTHRSLSATLLLAEILTHTGRPGEAAELLGGLPPEALSPSDREALTYCAAIGQGLLTGDTGGGAELVAGLVAGDPAASQYLHAAHAALLSFDARLQDGLDLGMPIMTDASVAAEARTLAALGVIGSVYWLGRTREAVAHVDALMPVVTSEAAQQAMPFGAASLELLAICALTDEGHLDRAEERATAMRRAATASHDPFGGPRAEYCLGRIALARGQADTAVRRLRRCIASLSQFDHFIARHLNSVLARASAVAGDLETAAAALEAGAELPRMKTYEAEWELAEAAVLAAGLRMDQAADRAAWAAGVAADGRLWNVAVTGYHDAARYGAARAILVPMRQAAANVDGTLAWCYVDHAAALAARDAAALDEVARRFETLGMLLFAAEAAAEAALEHVARGDVRAARSSGARAADWRLRCEGATSPWLAGVPSAVALTSRERQIAALAAAGKSDPAIAAHLQISARTVQTHLAHVYAKLGISRRADLAARL
jgi:DNA-binding CsgD family transcriptional regulator